MRAGASAAKRDTWSTRLSAYLQTYSAAELRRANNTLLRARLHSFDNRTRDRFLGLWYESYSAQTERDKKLGEIAAQYNWCRVVAAPLQLWFTRLTEQRAREAAAGAKADLRLKRLMFDRRLRGVRLSPLPKKRPIALPRGGFCAAGCSATGARLNAAKLRSSCIIAALKSDIC